ncbi:MAG TPA: 4Fe-4S dicluster domain-containing protein [Spirochaetia bacterium]|nr:4Fe-4S dicluster domain-containing protein [Spirochaetia bacterium]
MSKVRRLEIRREWCKGCTICVAFCPKTVLELDEARKAVFARPDDCVWCGDCEIRCPDLAITIVTEQAS